MFGRKKREKRPEHFIEWENGRLVTPTDCNCVGLNVYLGQKKQGGVLLNGVKKIVLPTVTMSKGKIIDPMSLTMTFRSWEEAEDVIKAMGNPHTVEIRIANQRLNNIGNWDLRGNFFILEAEPLEVAAEPVINGGNIEISVWFLVSRYTANDEKGNERWSFEWKRTDT